MTKLAHRYRAVSHRHYLGRLAGAVLIMLFSLLLNSFANNYTLLHRGNPINDIILDNLPTTNVEIIFVEGMIVLIGFVFFLGFHRPARIPFILKASALFILIRAFFFTLTHLGVPANQLAIHPKNFLENLITGSGTGLFFSGHTGFPFLWALIFWDNKTLRIIFLLASIFFAFIVLLGHLHYSIDVFSAFFISYGIYTIALKLFKKDYRLFEESL